MEWTTIEWTAGHVNIPHKPSLTVLIYTKSNGCLKKLLFRVKRALAESFNLHGSFPSGTAFSGKHFCSIYKILRPRIFWNYLFEASEIWICKVNFAKLGVL